MRYVFLIFGSLLLSYGISNEDNQLKLAFIIFATLILFIGILMSIIKANKYKNIISTQNTRIKDIKKEFETYRNEISHIEKSQLLNENIRLNKLTGEQTEYINILERTINTKEQSDYQKARTKVLNNYKRKELEKTALLDLISEGVIFQEEDPDLKYLKSIKKKYKLDF